MLIKSIRPGRSQSRASGRSEEALQSNWQLVGFASNAGKSPKIHRKLKNTRRRRREREKSTQMSM